MSVACVAGGFKRLGQLQGGRKKRVSFPNLLKPPTTRLMYVEPVFPNLKKKLQSHKF